MQFKEILVPIDYSHFSKKALETAVKLAECLGGKIYLIHVEEDIFHMKHIHRVHPSLKGYCEKFHENFVDEKEKQLEKFKKYIPQNLFAEAVVKEGHPFVEIIKFAKINHMDIIVISNKGRSNIENVFLGSTADRVSRKADCAVLIVKEKESE